MTTGSWTVGTNSNLSPLYAAKSWSGTNGRYEAWQGGTRDKWNTYAMWNKRWTQSPQPPYGYAGFSEDWTIAAYKATVGWNSNDDLRVLNKLAEEIRGHSFDLAINMAEAKKSYGLVLNNLRSVGSGLVNLKRGRVTDAFRSLGVPSRRQRPLRAKDVSGRWLEMQYGWRPLIDQAYEAGKALESVTKPRKLAFEASSKKSTRVNHSGSLAFYELWFSVQLSVKIKAELYEEMPLLRALGLTNPAAVVWEVVPYSFVVDWFLPVGSYLSAWGQIPSLKGRFLTISKGTQKGARFRKLGQFPLGMPPGGTAVREVNVRFERTPSTSLSVPAPSFNRLPRALSPARLYNAIALIHQNLR